MSYKYLFDTPISTKPLCEALGVEWDNEYITHHRSYILSEQLEEQFIELDEEGKNMRHPMYGLKQTVESNIKNRNSNIHRLYNTKQGIRQRKALGDRQRGAGNVNARKSIIIHKGKCKVYDYLGEFDGCNIPMPTLYSIAQEGRYSKKYDLYARYI